MLTNYIKHYHLIDHKPGLIYLSVLFFLSIGLFLVSIFFFNYTDINNTYIVSEEYFFLLNPFYYYQYYHYLLGFCFFGLILFILSLEDYYWHEVHLYLMLFLLIFSIGFNLFYGIYYQQYGNLVLQFILFTLLIIPGYLICFIRQTIRYYRNNIPILNNKCKFLSDCYNDYPFADCALIAILPLWFNFISVILISIVLIIVLFIRIGLFYSLVLMNYIKGDNDLKADIIKSGNNNDNSSGLNLPIPLYYYICQCILFFILIINLVYYAV